jgi:hypothetical protein
MPIFIPTPYERRLKRSKLIFTAIKDNKCNIRENIARFARNFKGRPSGRDLPD